MNPVNPDPTQAALHPSEHHDFAVRKGMGRFVVLVLGAIEHALLALVLGLELCLPAVPRWVRLTLARREHEAATVLQKRC